MAKKRDHTGFIGAHTGSSGADFVAVLSELCAQYKGRLRVEMISVDELKNVDQELIGGDDLDDCDSVFVFYEIVK